MSSSSEVLSQLGSDFIIKVVRIAFEAAFYGLYTAVNMEKRLIFFYQASISCLSPHQQQFYSMPHFLTLRNQSSLFVL